MKFLGDSRHKRGHWVLSSCGLHALKRWFHEKKRKGAKLFFRELEVRLVMQVEAFFSLLRSPRLATICATRKECIACTQGSTRQWRDSSYSRSRVDEKCTVEPINSFRRWVQKKQRNTKLAIFRRKCQNCMSNFEQGGSRVGGRKGTGALLISQFEKKLGETMWVSLCKQDIRGLL